MPILRQIFQWWYLFFSSR